MTSQTTHLEIVPLRHVLSITNLTDQALRVRAVRAATEYDLADLLLITRAYMAAGSRNRAHTSDRTLTAYLLSTRLYVTWAHENGVTILRPARRDASRYVSWLQTRPTRDSHHSRPLSPASIASYVSGERVLYRALRWAEATESDPFRDTVIPSDPTPGIVKNPPYGAEIDVVLKSCQPRERALLLLCAHTGLRISEALAVRVSDISDRQLLVRGKGRKLRRVPLGKRVREALNKLEPLEGGRYFEWKYATAAYRMKRAFRYAGLEDSWRGFHAARKYSGTRLYEATQDFTRVGVFLGHASVNTTRRYVVVKDHDVRKEVENF